MNDLLELAAPGLRENWETGDRTLHYPYQERKATDRSA